MRLPPLLFPVFLTAVLATACSAPPATDTVDRARSPRDSVVAAGVGLGGFGSVRGQLLPAGVEAMIHVTAQDDGQAVIDPTFSDPLSGEFSAEELPVDVYRVEVEPLDPAYARQVFEGVVVPFEGVEDLGTVDLRRPPADNVSGVEARGTGEAR